MNTPEVYVDAIDRHCKTWNINNRNINFINKPILMMKI